MSWLSAIGTWLLKLFLSGLFNKVMTKVEMEAKQKEDRAKLHAETTVAATEVEKKIVEKQAKVEVDIKTTPKPADDPFNTDAWNKGNQSNG